MEEIKGILIDSGRVLNFPTTGNWSYSPDFFNIVDKDKFDKIPKHKRKEAFSKAWKYLDSENYVSTIEEEEKIFKKFFEIIFSEISELGIDNNKIELLTKDMVYNYKKVTFFQDVFQIIPKLKEKYKLVIVSDAWPSIREVYKNADLYKYFEDIIISSEIGVCKPHENMYLTALKKVNLKPSEVIFIDDCPFNCDGASKLGIKSIILERNFINRLNYKFRLKTKHKIIKNLYELDIK